MDHGSLTFVLELADCTIINRMIALSEIESDSNADLINLIFIHTLTVPRKWFHAYHRVTLQRFVLASRAFKPHVVGSVYSKDESESSALRSRLFSASFGWNSEVATRASRT